MWLNVALLSVAASRVAGAPMLHAAHKARVTMQPSNSRAARPCRVPSRAKQLATQWAAKRCDDDERGAGGRALSEPHDATVEEFDVPAVLIDEQTGRTIDCELLHTVKVGENVYASMSPRDHPVTISRYVDGELLELGEDEDPQLVKLLPTAIKACDELGMSLIHSAVSLTLAGDLDSVPPPPEQPSIALDEGRDPIRGDRIQIDEYEPPSAGEPPPGGYEGNVGEGQAEIFAEFMWEGDKHYVILLDPIFVVGKQKGAGSVEFTVPSEEEMDECIPPLEQEMLKQIDEIFPDLNLDDLPSEIDDDYDELCGDSMRRRRALAAASRAAPSHGERTASPSRGWTHEWSRRFECWWMGLPGLTQSRLSACLGALSLHLGSRLDAAFGRRAVSASRESGCEWLNENTLELQMIPDFPSPSQFVLPPIPRLLPNLVPGFTQLQSLSAPGARISANPPATHEPSPTLEAVHRSSATFGPMLLSAVGGGAVAAALVLLCGTCHKSPKPAQILPNRAILK